MSQSRAWRTHSSQELRSAETPACSWIQTSYRRLPSVSALSISFFISTRRSVSRMASLLRSGNSSLQRLEIITHNFEDFANPLSRLSFSRLLKSQAFSDPVVSQIVFPSCPQILFRWYRIGQRRRISSSLKVHRTSEVPTRSRLRAQRPEPQRRSSPPQSLPIERSCPLVGRSRICRSRPMSRRKNLWRL